MTPDDRLLENTHGNGAGTSAESTRKERRKDIHTPTTSCITRSTYKYGRVESATASCMGAVGNPWQRWCFSRRDRVLAPVPSPAPSHPERYTSWCSISAGGRRRRMPARSKPTGPGRRHRATAQLVGLSVGWYSALMGSTLAWPRPRASRARHRASARGILFTNMRSTGFKGRRQINLSG